MAQSEMDKMNLKFFWLHKIIETHEFLTSSRNGPTSEEAWQGLADALEELVGEENE